MIGRIESDLGPWGNGPERDKLTRVLNQIGRLHNVDTKLKTNDGGASDYVLSAETISIHGEHCVLTVMLDITERKQTEAELLAAIDSVMQDTSWFGQKIVEKSATVTRHSALDLTSPKVGDLTPRAREVVGLMAQGLSDDEIASKLGVSRNTIRNHVSAIHRATGMHKRSALVVWARDRGLGN